MTTELSDLRQRVDEGLGALFNKMLAPKASCDALMLSGQPIDNLSWVDFTDVRFVIQPIVNDYEGLSHGAFVGPDPEELLLLAASVEDEGGDSDPLLDFTRAMQTYLQDGLRTLFTENSAVAGMAKLPPGTVVLDFLFQPYEEAFYDPTTGVLTIPYDPDHAYDPLHAHPAAVFDLPLLAQFVALAAFERPALLADLMTVYDAVCASGAPAEGFWLRLRDFMMSGFGYEPPAWVGHYVNLYKEIERDPSTAKQSIYFQASVNDHWPKTLAALTSAFAAEISATGAGHYKSPPVPEDHGFVTFVPYRINCGLRLLYRQTWRHLGNQRGEVVRTIPLGPKQVEKVSTKILRRTKFARTAESLSSSETARETADTCKDSSEIIREASSSLNSSFSTSVDASVSIGVVDAKGSQEFSVGGQTAQKSGETQTHLTETMQRIATKLRQESKVVVSTESEQSFEATTASEITNPNEEIAVTYVYSKLQRQFQIVTQLAELQDVIMIAEPLPRPVDITAEWVKRYDWILSKVLLDDSYRDALSYISQDPNVASRADLASKLHLVLTDTIAGLKACNTAPGNVSGVDFVATSQKNYREIAEASIEAEQRVDALRAQRDRLLQHIRDNVLHYCRAIYAQEDPQQRILRYQRHGVRIPLDWRPLPIFLGAPVRWAPVPSAGGGRWVDVAEAINPAGPIGYFGNCAMYYVRPELNDAARAGFRPRMSATLFQLLSCHKWPYLAPKVDQNGDLVYEADGRTPKRCPDAIMDPVLIDLIETYPPAYVAENADELLTPSVVSEMNTMVPELRLEAARQMLVPQQQGKDDKPPDSITDPAVLKYHYAMYLFLKKQSRLCVVDTNTVMIDLLAGDGSTLEPFKLAHRGMDVLHKREETRNVELKNARLEHFQEDREFYEPDKLVVEKRELVTSKESSSADDQNKDSAGPT